MAKSEFNGGHLLGELSRVGGSEYLLGELSIIDGNVVKFTGGEILSLGSGSVNAGGLLFRTYFRLTTAGICSVEL